MDVPLARLPLARPPAGSSLRILGVIAVLLPSLAPDAAAQATRTVEAGPEYRGPVRLQAPVAGIAFSLPSGYTGAWDGEVGGLVFTAGSERILGVWGWSEAEVPEVAAEIGARLESAGFVLHERGRPESDDDRFRGFFHIRSGQETGLLYAVIRRGPQGNAAAVLGVGPPEAEEELVGVVDGAVASLELSDPGARAWQAEVEGTVLGSGAASSDYSPGGTASGSSASQSTATLALCGGARYRYESVSETYVSIEGASASSTSSDGHAGQWWLVADLAGHALLYLESDDGRVFSWNVVERAEDVVVDGTAYGVSGTC